MTTFFATAPLVGILVEVLKIEYILALRILTSNVTKV